MQRHGKHGNFPEIFKQVFGIDHYPKTTASQLPQLYPAAYHHFCTLDYNDQMTITWSKLVNSFKIKKEDSIGMKFVYFTQPALLSSSECVNPPIKALPSPQQLPSPQLLAPPKPLPSPRLLLSPKPSSPTPLEVPKSHLKLVNLQPNTCTSSTLPDTSCLTAPFPLEKATLHPLDQEQRLLLEANSNLIQETRKTLGNIAVEDEIDQLVGSKTYSGFNAEDEIRELQAIASLAGWPNPPNFSSLQGRVWEKQCYLDSIILEIQMATADASRFYKYLFSMGAAKWHLQSLEIMSTG
jgi:hypothetical protein